MLSRPDPRAPVQPGRRALLRDGGPDRRGSRAAAAAGPARLRRLRPDPGDEAVDAAGGVPGRRSSTWDHAEARAEAGARGGRRSPTPSTKATARSTGRRSTSTSPTRSAASGSARPSSSITRCRERFELKYVGADNAEHRPVVIHRAIFGSFERFIALLIEHYAGAFPLWLAPVQVAVLPIADRHAEYARSVRDRAGGGRPARRARRAPGEDRTIRSAKLSCRRSPICWWPATARRRRATCRRPQPERRAIWAPGGRARSSRRRAGDRSKGVLEAAAAKVMAGSGNASR